MPDTTTKQHATIDLDHLAATGREVIKAREAKAKEEAERREAERIKELCKAWDPYIRAILVRIAERLPLEDAEEVGLDIVAPGWTITIPNGRPYANGMYYPVTLALDGCMPINCWAAGQGSVAFEAAEPDLVYGDDGEWIVRTEYQTYGRGNHQVVAGESDLAVAVAHAKAGYERMQELTIEANRRNENQILPSVAIPDPQPEATDYLKEAKRVEETLSKIDVPSTAAQFQAGVLAALIAIGEELRIRHY